MEQHEEKTKSVGLAIELAIMQGEVTPATIRKALPAVLPLLHPVHGRWLTQEQTRQVLKILAIEDGLGHVRSDQDQRSKTIRIMDLIVNHAFGLYDELPEEFKMGGAGVREG